MPQNTVVSTNEAQSFFCFHSFPLPRITLELRSAGDGTGLVLIEEAAEARKHAQ